MGFLSSPITISSLPSPSRKLVAFIARHGPGHVSPSAVPSRANISAVKSLSVRAILFKTLRVKANADTSSPIIDSNSNMTHYPSDFWLFYWRCTLYTTSILLHTTATGSVLFRSIRYALLYMPVPGEILFRNPAKLTVTMFVGASKIFCHFWAFSSWAGH